VTNNDFGTHVAQKAQKLLASGKDPNQIANILFQEDSAGRNYGIGIILDGLGQPVKSSPTLLAAIKQKLEESTSGTYQNSAARMQELKKEVCAWQRIPEKYASQFKLVIPSDAGTGAVTTALQTSILLDPKRTTLGVEKMSWPAYKTIARVLGMRVREVPLGEPAGDSTTIPIYQPGPHNSTGRVPNREEVRTRAEKASHNGGWTLLDRAYSGFEYARLLEEKSYDEIMRLSYETQIAPFIDANVPFFLAISPTKAFVTFSLRPCGMLLAFCPNTEIKETVSTAFNTVIRARGSSFEHSVTRAFVDAITENRSALEKEHAAAIMRVATAEKAWKQLAAGTSLEAVFSEKYAGLFRNVAASEEAEAALYNEHLYPVFPKGRCRLNTTGLPNDMAAAKKDVSLFARYCRA
jgi:aspartate/tyrosine/aromatic aminotransferase